MVLTLIILVSTLITLLMILLAHIIFSDVTTLNGMSVVEREEDLPKTAKLGERFWVRTSGVYRCTSTDPITYVNEWEEEMKEFRKFIYKLKHNRS